MAVGQWLCWPEYIEIAAAAAFNLQKADMLGFEQQRPAGAASDLFHHLLRRIRLRAARHHAT